MKYKIEFQKAIIFFALLMPFFNLVKAQEDLTVMFYNMLKFPSSTPDRADTLKKIIQHTQPDIFIVSELKSAYGGTVILNHALNADGVSYYSKAVFQDANGSDTDNLLFYNHNKIGLKEQNNVNTSLRAISEYIVYYKDPNLAITHDTTFIYLYGCHLKAGTAADYGNGASLNNGQRRNSAVQSLKNYLTNHNRTQNIIVGGDMNMYTSNETAYSTMLTGGTVDLFDPIDETGVWHNTYSHRNVHTQSSRCYGCQTYGGGSSGGLDDRFDIIFVSNDILNGSQGVKYNTGSYRAVGQDGSHFNKSVNYGSNFDVPQDVANALFYTSDHLPILLKIKVGGPVSIQELDNLVDNFNFNTETKILSVQFSSPHQKVELKIYNTSGQLIVDQHYQNTQSITDYLQQLTAGIYIINIVADGTPVSAKVMVY